MWRNYILCGITGWCAEILFTSIKSAIHQDWRLVATTSLWMFPIYGLAALIPSIYKRIKKMPWFIRGIVYMIGIFATEFITGSILQYFGVCPWDYSDCPRNFKGIIRLDYAPFWFLLGLFYERLLLQMKSVKSISTTKKVAEHVHKKHR